MHITQFTGTGNLLTATGEFLLPLLTIPKSLDPFLAILLHGLMNGSVSVREVAAETIGELAKMTDPVVLKPVLIKATGNRSSSLLLGYVISVSE